MNTLNFPTGISVSQAKKDAKKLAKTNQIKLHAAQDIIAHQHARMNWSKAIDILSSNKPLQVELTDKFNNKLSIDFPTNKSLTFVYGKPGSGKSAILHLIAEQLLKHHKITYITIRGGLSKETEDNFKAIYGDRINFIFYDLRFGQENNVDLRDVDLNGSVLIIDEFHRFDLLVSNKNILNLIRSLCHANPAARGGDSDIIT